LKNITYILILFFTNTCLSQKAIVKDTIYVDSSKQVIVYLPVNEDGDLVSDKIVKTMDLVEEKIVEPEIEKLDQGLKATESLDTENSKEEAEKIKAPIKVVEPEKENMGSSIEMQETGELETEEPEIVKQDIVEQVVVQQVESDTIKSSVEDLTLEQGEEANVSETESLGPEKDYELIHKTNRILVWRLLKRFMYFADLKYDHSSGVNKSMENYRDLFQNNAVIYHDLMNEPEHVDYRDYFDDVSEYFDNVKVEQEFEDVWLIYNRLFQSDLKALETESNFSDEDQSSFYYELPVKKYVSNKIGDDGKIIRLDEPEEYNLRFKILVDYQQLEAHIAGIYLN